MAWCWTGKKPLSAQMMAKLIDAYMRHFILSASKTQIVYIYISYHSSTQNCHWYLKSFVICSCPLAPGRCGSYFKSIIFKLIIQDSSLGNSCEVALRWMPQNLGNEKLTLVQAMAWYHQATSHYLNKCWPRSMSPYGITRPQWVKDPSIICC